MCKWFKKTPAIIQPAQGAVPVSRDDYLAALRNYDVQPISLSDPLDSLYFLHPLSELQRIAKELVYPADWYIEQFWDCENYGLQAANDAGKLWAGVVLLLGNMELGYHGFAGALDLRRELWLLESNAGFPWAGQWFPPKTPIDEMVSGYLPRKVFA